MKSSSSGSIIGIRARIAHQHAASASKPTPMTTTAAATHGRGSV